MIQDIRPHVFDNSFKPRRPESGDFILIYGDEKVLLLDDGATGGETAGGEKADPTPQPGGGYMLPQYERLDGLAPGCENELQYLFGIDSRAFFYLRSDCIREHEKLHLIETPMGSFRSYGTKWLAFAGITACHLAGWYERHRICGKCGAYNRHSDKERMLECPGCGSTYYPRISPAVIVGVTDGARLLLTRYANRPVANYALIAGFCEIGESVEETVSREVMEEVGICVKNIRFYKSQPWGFSSSLLMGFYCDLDGSDSITLDRSELAVAEWFDRKDIAITDTSVSLTGEMIEFFRSGPVQKEK
jgi:NAD+ diphosphatase